MTARAARPRRIVVTGVTRGLGRALVEGFAAAGHAVFGCGRSEEALAGLRGRVGPPSAFARVDVADDGQVAAWAREVFAAGGPPDLVVNNAALINRNAPLWEVPAREFSDVVDVNVKGTVNVIRHFLPAMLAVGRGVVANMSSGWGRSTSPEVAPYCATKWAVEGLTRALAQELPRGLAAVAVSPGVIDTEMLRSCFGVEASRHPGPEAWARGAVPFFLGLSAEDNGRSLTIPGGREE